MKPTPGYYQYDCKYNPDTSGTHHQNPLSGGNMCNFHGYDNARCRRHERRSAKRAAYNYNKALNLALKAALNPSKKSNQLTTPNPKRPVLSLKRKMMSRVEKAISIRLTKVYDSFDNCCLPEIALYTAKRFKNKPKLNFGVTANV
ncbi:hypothetical protein [Candidatus Arsenophonus triatominarum]|uniref:transcriptional antitermination N peptide n=2 Tax=Candidatus Arsenophonus triatominarum TaxID=57911 RepID=UPI001FE0B38B|nr:hypothetical protein [Candidatus Arsenophonus triatominarum]